MDNKITERLNINNLSKNELEELIFTIPLAEISGFLKEFDDNTKSSPVKNIWKGFRKGATLPKSKISNFINNMYDEENYNILKFLCVGILLYFKIDLNNFSVQDIENIPDLKASFLLLKLLGIEKTYSALEIEGKLKDLASLKEQEKEELKKNYEEKLDNINKEHEDEINEINNKISDLTEELNALNTEYSNLEKENNNLKKQNKLLNLKLEEYSDEKEQEDNNNYDTINVLKDFNKYLCESGLSYNKQDIYNFHFSLMTRNLTILAGTPGIGKSRLALEYAKFFKLSEEDNTLLFVSISPSYTEPADILGFLNPKNHEFVPTETNLAQFLVHASKHPELVHMLIFDEMNLAQIEYYFSPFIANLENKRQTINLYADGLDCINKDKYPSQIKVHDNLLIVGTINKDETTRELSERLLDRINLINLQEEPFTKYRNNQKIYRGIKSNYNYDINRFMPKLPTNTDIINLLSAEMTDFFDELNIVLMNNLQSYNFSYRNLFNVITLYYYMINNMPESDAFDYAFSICFIVKISGSSLALGNIINLIIGILDKYKVLSPFTYTREKLSYKQKELDRYGFTR